MGAVLAGAAVGGAIVAINDSKIQAAIGGVSSIGPGNLPKIAVVVLSAGPNRTIETNGEQQFDEFTPFGDDIVFRVK